MFPALSRQLLLFLFAGLAQLALDWALFVLLTHVGVPLVAANVAGRLSGACLGFWLNGRFTFAEDGHARLGRAHLGRFVLAWSGLTVISTVLLAALAQRYDLQAAWLGKPAVEALMAAIGFVVWRQWVFR